MNESRSSRSIGARRNETPRASTAMTGESYRAAVPKRPGAKGSGSNGGSPPRSCAATSSRFRRRGSRPRAVARRHRQAVGDAPDERSLVGRHRPDPPPRRTHLGVRGLGTRSIAPHDRGRDAGVLGLRRDRRLPRARDHGPSVVGCNRVDVAGPTSSRSPARTTPSSHRPVTVSPSRRGHQVAEHVRHALEPDEPSTRRRSAVARPPDRGAPSTTGRRRPRPRRPRPAVVGDHACNPAAVLEQHPRRRVVPDGRPAIGGHPRQRHRERRRRQPVSVLYEPAAQDRRRERRLEPEELLRLEPLHGHPAARYGSCASSPRRSAASSRPPPPDRLGVQSVRHRAPIGESEYLARCLPSAGALRRAA